MLNVENLSAGYGDIIAVRELSFSVDEGQILAFLGANGAGKTSAMMCLMGLVEQKSGTIIMNSENISEKKAEARIRSGLAIVPEGRRVFPDLSVRENLLVGGHTVAAHIMTAAIDYVYSVFPRLAERRAQSAGSLSGGEQQMLALGRALVSQPKLLIVDELSLGLMPKVVDECYAVLDTLKRNNIGVLLVEQNTDRALSVADKICVLEAGNLIWSGSAMEAKNNASLTERLMGFD
ncbi:ABC transporter ATP-binding protein [Chromatiales bacterium (ex Bugula neritina AB1)]|nr:ABC transporter ATP-binding protein [Chromatiales bacterium (ex Bugula neritina AB1)]